MLLLNLQLQNELHRQRDLAASLNLALGRPEAAKIWLARLLAPTESARDHPADHIGTAYLVRLGQLQERWGEFDDAALAYREAASRSQGVDAAFARLSAGMCLLRVARDLQRGRGTGSDQDVPAATAPAAPSMSGATADPPVDHDDDGDDDGRRDPVERAQGAHCHGMLMGELTCTSFLHVWPITGQHRLDNAQVKNTYSFHSVC